MSSERQMKDPLAVQKDLSSTVNKGPHSKTLIEKRAGLLVAGTRTIRPTATGPRTLQGKQKSKYNAMKHGIFSDVAVLKSESRAGYDALLTRLRDSLQPEGKLEDILVEKLAMLLWRHRRLITAETNEVRKGSEFLAWDKQLQELKEAADLARDAALLYKGGLIQHIQNGNVLNFCLFLLAELRDDVQTSGFTPEDSAILEKLYGKYAARNMQGSLYSMYLVFSYAAGLSDAERLSTGGPSPDQCKQKAVEQIDEEIRRLKRYRKAQATVQADRLRLEASCLAIPEGPVLDRFLRYEAVLERAFERTLAQLERMQRIRFGQPTLPEINVKLSS